MSYRAMVSAGKERAVRLQADKANQVNHMLLSRAKFAREQANTAPKALSPIHRRTKSLAADAPHLADLQQHVQDVVTQSLSEMPAFGADTEEESVAIATAHQYLGQLYFDSDQVYLAHDQW